jgi:hypothetical protein
MTKRNARGKDGCLLCGRRQAFLGILFPHRPAEFGDRTAIPYALCARCYWRPDKAELAEERILERAKKR